jgi:hypothetical protein
MTRLSSRFVVSFVLASGISAGAQASFAADGDSATIRLTHNAFRYFSSTTESEPKGEPTTKVEKSGYATFSSTPLSLELAVWAEGYAFYFYPVSEGGSAWVGKSIGDNLEVGGTLGLNNDKTKDGDEIDATSVGAYLWYAQKLGGSTLELNLNPYITTNKSKTTTNEEEASSFTLYFDAFAVVPIAKNFEYAAGIDYTYTTKDQESSVMATATKTKSKEKVSDLGLVLARFRYII